MAIRLTLKLEAHPRRWGSLSKTLWEVLAPCFYMIVVVNNSHQEQEEGGGSVSLIDRVQIFQK